MVLAAAREFGMIAAAWPVAFGLLLIAVELPRARVDLRLVGSALLLGLLFSVIGAIVFDVAETIRQRATGTERFVTPALAADALIFAGALLTMTLTPWNTVPAIGFAGLALGAAIANLLLVAAQRARRRRSVTVVVSVIVTIALVGGGAIGAGTFAAVTRVGLGALSADLPPPPVP